MKTKLKYIFFFTFFLVVSVSTSAQQNKIDSLQTVLKTAKNDTNKVNTLNELGWKLMLLGDYEKAILIGNQAKDLGIKLSFKKGIAKAHNNIGTIYYFQGNYPKALKQYFASLKIYEEIKDKKWIAKVYNNIGNIYSDQGNYPEALKNYFASLKICEEIRDKNGIAISYNNIGNIYNTQGNYHEALKQHFACLKISEELGEKKLISSSYNNIGVIYNNQGNYLEALKQYFASLKIREEIGDKQGMANSYNNIGTTYIYLKQTIEAKNYLDKALKLGLDIGYKENVKFAYQNLSTLDSLKGEHKQALAHYKLYILYRDSLNNEETKEKTIQEKMNYEFEKKEALAKLEQDKKDALALIKLQSQKKQRNYFIAGFILIALFAYFMYNRFKITSKQKTQIEHAHKELGEKNKEILDSINYAKRIQSAILPPQKQVKELLPQSFILYKPKDIVAGDFYWLEQKEDKILFAAADCTGHGVPGAMVSVVCNNGLNRSVREHGLSEPGKILDKTREIVIAEFEKSEEEVKDGMDISLCSLSGKTLQWAGANNPIWVIRSCHSEGSEESTKRDASFVSMTNIELIEFKPNKQPIGKMENPTPFTTHTIELQKGDSVYIFTDGYQDQFGGEKGKKFKAAQLQEILLSIQNRSMEEQKQIIEEAFTKWKGNLEQVDDVCLIGVRV